MQLKIRIVDAKFLQFTYEGHILVLVPTGGDLLEYLSHVNIRIQHHIMFGRGSPPDELEASPAGSCSDDYSLAFLWFSAPPPPKLRTILVCYCCSNWPGLPEPPSLRSKTKRRSQCFRALPANENSPPFTGAWCAAISCKCHICGLNFTNFEFDTRPGQVTRCLVLKQLSVTYKRGNG